MLVSGQHLPVVPVSVLMVTTTGVGGLDAGDNSVCSLTMVITFCKINIYVDNSRRDKADGGTQCKTSITDTCITRIIFYSNITEKHFTG